MIEPRQILAARALLNWSQDDLAKASGIARSSIKNIENEITVARRDTIDDIKRALEGGGVVFGLDGGIKPHRGEVQILNGKEGFKTFFDVVYAEMKGGGEIFVSGIDEAQITRILEGHGDKHIDRMSRLKDMVSVKCLLKEGDKNFKANSYCEYRWVSKDYFETTHFYVFNQKVAIISLLTDDDIYVIIHDIPKLAEKSDFFILMDIRNRQPAIDIVISIFDDAVAIYALEKIECIVDEGFALGRPHQRRSAFHARVRCLD